MLIDVGEGVRIHAVEAGAGEPVILCHGFPELWWSWRHQLPALAAAGYRPVALDMRGFGLSSRPEAVEAYDLVEMERDVLGVIDALGAERAVLVGHDWGAVLAWHVALSHPDRVRGVAGLSVPLIPRGPAPPTPLMREHLGEDFYFVWLQTPGVADAALARDVRRTIATQRPWDAAWAADEGDDPPTPRFMTDGDIQVYVDAYERTGFTGGLNWYRNLDRTWERTAHLDGARLRPPAMFLTGERDQVAKWMPHQIMEGVADDLREVVVVPEAGHWVQQQAPAEVNAALVHFLDGLEA